MALHESLGSTWLIVNVLAASVTAILLLSAPGLVLGPSPDAGVFASSGWLMAHDGRLPYRDIWDHKPPGLFVTSWLSQLIVPVGDPWFRLWVVSAGATAAACTMVGSAVARAHGSTVGVLTALVAAIVTAAFPLSLGGGLSENIALPATTGALLIAAQRPGATAAWIFVGVLSAVGASITLQTIAIGPALFWFAAAAGGGRQAIGRVAAIGAGWLVVAAVAITALGSAGLLEHAFDQLVRYNAIYLGLGAGSDTAIARETALRMLPLAVLVLVVPLVDPGSRPRSALLVGSWIYLATGIALLLAQSRFFAHYLIPLAIPASIAAAPTLERILSIRGRYAGWSGLGIGAALMLWAAILTVPAVRDPGSYLGYGRRAVNDAVAASVREIDPRGRTAFIWGFDAELYHVMDRVPVGPYLYTMPLTTPGYSEPGQLDSLMAQLRSTPPEIVIDAGSSAPGREGMVPLLESRDVRPAGGRNADIIDPLRAFIRTQYRHVATAQGWPVYIHEAVDRSTSDQ